uniref:NADH-ubiquinone oxidoreductase chain 6 n=1 Tax=Nargus velox TaxID=290668 RepID=S4SUR7_NARVE|nr:NADH dehydrogenase subunit 6 [Nargus velox]ALO70734.1 NADH deshydrogenase subunit 6 [Nargus velox]
MLYMMTISIFTSIIILFMNHPLSMGFCLLIQTIQFSLISGYISLNFWFSYIIFLMMISGMLILFLYMTSIASNKKFKLMKWSFYIWLFFISIMSSLLILNINLFKINNLNMFNNYNMNFMLTKFFNMPLSMILFMMIIYLLITLIATVKITNMKSGPLRQKF